MKLLFDIGGTKMRMAVSEDGVVFCEPKIMQTPENFEEMIETFKNTANELSKGEKIEIAGGGVKGPFNREKTMVINSSKFLDWNNKPLKESLEKAISAPVFIENDAAIAGLGEMQYGAGKNAEIGVYITVSTGVGGARFINGQIDKNRFGFEPGHQIFNIKDKDALISLQDIISGEALEKRAGKRAYEVNNENEWDRLASYLAYGLYNTILHWSPDIVVLGGSMIIGKPAIDIEKVKKYLNNIDTKFFKSPEIKEAKLNDLGGLYGAMSFLKDKNG